MSVLKNRVVVLLGLAIALILVIAGFPFLYRVIVPLIQAAQPEDSVSTDAEAYALVIHTLVGRSNLTGSTLYIRTLTNDGVAQGVMIKDVNPKPIPTSVQTDITRLLADLHAEVVWIGDYEAGMAAAQEGDLVFSLSSIQPQENGSVQVAVGYSCPGWCGAGANYILEAVDNGWHIIGETGGWTS
jgi:hypothetical protein